MAGTGGRRRALRTCRLTGLVSDRRPGCRPRRRSRWATCSCDRGEIFGLPAGQPDADPVTCRFGVTPAGVGTRGFGEIRSAVGTICGCRETSCRSRRAAWFCRLARIGRHDKRSWLRLVTAIGHDRWTAGSGSLSIFRSAWDAARQRIRFRRHLTRSTRAGDACSFSTQKRLHYAASGSARARLSVCESRASHSAPMPIYEPMSTA